MPATREAPAIFTPSTEQVPSKSLLRAICLAASNTILHSPAVFELQQRFFNQPGLIRSEVENELQFMRKLDGDFKILDYGCGSGTYSGLFSSNNYIGIDMSNTMLQRAASQHPGHTFIQASNISSISARLSKVSHVLMIGVVHHMSDETCMSIFSSLPKTHPVRVLTIDTLKCDQGPGSWIQLFERGEYLRPEREHRALLNKMIDEVSYKKVPYGSWFDLAIVRGIVKR